MVPYIKSLSISQASVLECVDKEIAAGNTIEVQIHARFFHWNPWMNYLKGKNCKQLQSKIY